MKKSPVFHYAPTDRTATKVVAASNSSADGQMSADYICDGVADDVEINEAITYCETAGGGRVLLLEGNFVTANRILIDDGYVTLEGQGHGTIIDGSALVGAQDVIELDNNVYKHGQSVKNLTILGDSGNRHGLSMYKALYFHIENLRIEGFTDSASYGIWMVGGCWAGVFIGMTILTCYNGMRLEGGAGLQSGAFTVMSSEINLWALDGIGIHCGITGAFGMVEFTTINIPGCGDGVNAKGVYIEGGFNITCNNLEIEGDITNGTPYGIKADNTSGLVISNCSFWRISTYPISVAGTNYNSAIFSNFYDLDLGGANAATAMIQMAGNLQPTCFANRSDTGIPTYDMSDWVERLMFVFEKDFDTAGVKIADVRYNMDVIDVIIHCTETNGGGTVQLLDLNGGNAITDAIVCDTDHVVTRVGTIDDAHYHLVEGDDLWILPANATKGTMYVIIGDSR